MLVAGISPRRPRFDKNAVVENLWWDKFVSDHVSFTLSVTALPILLIYIHLLPTLYVLDQECPTGGNICKFIWVGVQENVTIFTSLF